ncbi:hypothetical protein B0H10DRAFT_2066204 [Mycena sp. CBHHK59/15]|nr:hypothetical protein B0H10DRAFT_2066204 [Mycena sp. CBHHK59/15]
MGPTIKGIRIGRGGGFDAPTALAFASDAVECAVIVEDASERFVELEAMDMEVLGSVVDVGTMADAVPSDAAASSCVNEKTKNGSLVDNTWFPVLAWSANRGRTLDSTAGNMKFKAPRGSGTLCMEAAGPPLRSTTDSSRTGGSVGSLVHVICMSDPTRIRRGSRSKVSPRQVWVNGMIKRTARVRRIQYCIEFIQLNMGRSKATFRRRSREYEGEDKAWRHPSDTRTSL